MTTAEVRAFYLAYIDLINAREFGRLAEFVHDRVDQNGEPADRDDMTASLRQYTELLPDLVWKVEELVVEGNTIAARLVDKGTPAKEWLGLAPTGASVTFGECAFYRIRDGRIEASWYLMDADAVRRQLGAP